MRLASPNGDEQAMRDDRDRKQFRGYHVAQVCLNGHSINDSSDSYPEYNQRFCAACGAETITTCWHCNDTIRGAVRGELNWGNYHPPAFCHNCGKPYPWMQDRLQTAKDLLYNDDKLSLEEREKLWGILGYVMSDPKADLVAAKKKLFEIEIAKALPATRDLLMDFMAKLTAEMMKS